MKLKFLYEYERRCEITCAGGCAGPSRNIKKLAACGVRCAVMCVACALLCVSVSLAERTRVLQDRHGGVGVSIMINRPTRQLSHAITLHHGSQDLKVKTNGSSST